MFFFAAIPRGGVCSRLPLTEKEISARVVRTGSASGSFSLTRACRGNRRFPGIPENGCRFAFRRFPSFPT